MTDEDTPEKLDTHRVELSDSSWCRLKTEDELTGKDVRTIRKAMDLDGAGSITNALYSRALTALIAEWEITYRPGLDIPSRLTNPELAFDALRAGDLRTLERRVEAFVKDMTGKAETDPQPPASA